MAGVSALRAEPKDWWITLEANEDDVAGYELSVQLFAAPPEGEPPCSDRFCLNTQNPAARYAQGQRDADDNWGPTSWIDRASCPLSWNGAFWPRALCHGRSDASTPDCSR